MEYMRLGGSIMWIILAMSVAALALVIERMIFFSISSTDPARLEAAFKRALAEGGASAAKSVSTGRSSLHRLFSEASSNWQADDEGMRTLLNQQLRRELYRWGKNLSFLEITAKISPLLGLLGTVLGMVEMFHTLSIDGSVNSSAVTGGIWKALFTTVAGLAAAIPMIIAHGLLSGRIDREEETLRRGMDFIIRERMGHSGDLREICDE